MHADEAALLAAIAADPAAPEGWLVLADWLDERDDPRGELVRLCHAVRGRGTEEGPERDRDEARVRDLLRPGVRPCVPEFVNTYGMRFVLVPDGTFWMGTAGNLSRRVVTVARPFFLSVHPVTQAQWRAVIGTQPAAFRPGGRRADEVAGVGRTDEFPVESVAARQAEAFCRKLGEGYRLPAEAEWEYAARGAGVHSGRFWWGDRPDPAFFNHHASGIGRPTPVGSYLPNALGLFDTSGNVQEWCSDEFGGPPEPSEAERFRRKRGGCFGSIGFAGSLGRRSYAVANVCSETIGFRLALDIEGVA